MLARLATALDEFRGASRILQEKIVAGIYKVKTVEVDGKIHVKWASSEGAARKAKKELAEEHGLRPLKDVSYDQVDVPTSKAGIIEWLNEHHAVEPV